MNDVGRLVWDKLADLRLKSMDSGVYGCVLDGAAVDLPSLSEALGITVQEAAESLERLSELGLVHQEDVGCPLYSPVGPESAALVTLLPLETELRRRTELIAHARRDLESLVPVYHDSSAWRQRMKGVQVLGRLQDVRNVLAEHAANCRDEVLTAQPGGGRRTEVLEEAVERDENMLCSGVRMRTLYQHSARFSPPTAAYVERITLQGGEVRTTSAEFMRLIVFDRRVAVISQAGNSLGAVVVEEPSVVDFAVQAFEHVWFNAEPFEVDVRREHIESVSEDVDKALLRLLASGMDDAAIARRLGVSLRTCQRRVSRILDSLGARSRFQAGFLIHKYGLLAEPSA
ncbi:helix-turn-helix transcriptional regulator [Streptomyces sp. B1I3]|uniref:helix-turn-helix domain-containing protein n=1 Tax=Streptomyces sp. B1I3 TaxID=3042264 RepID=UPI0027D8D64F|nr:helix-turn-helix transcriptional regulator [Streptomyces sp. B1I3]